MRCWLVDVNSAPFSRPFCLSPQVWVLRLAHGTKVPLFPIPRVVYKRGYRKPSAEHVRLGLGKSRSTNTAKKHSELVRETDGKQRQEAQCSFRDVGHYTTKRKNKMKMRQILACAVVALVTCASQGRARAKGPQRLSESCAKNLAFAIAGPSGVVPGTPKFARGWVRKNAKKYPGLCFSQTVNPNAANYLLVFSTAQSAFIGFSPTVRTTTATSTGSVSGNGMVTDNYGNVWTYTYNGAVTTTATTTTTENVPYLDTTRTLYLYAYDQQGKIISKRNRSITTRQGGDPTSGAFYNVGALLKSRIDTRGRLLGAIVKDVSAANGIPEPQNPLKALLGSPGYFQLPLDEQVTAVFNVLGPKYGSLPQHDKEEVVRRLNQRYQAMMRGSAEASVPSPYLGMYQPSPERMRALKAQQPGSAGASVESMVPGSVSPAEFPLTAIVTLVQKVDGEHYWVSVQIGNIAYVLQGPRVDPGRYHARFDYNGQDKIVKISVPDQNENPTAYTYQIESEKAH